ncbi:vesicle-associated membrane 4 [Brachionus plicatilis]|uniref:Vesicle-associated membrane 4 n=1 Tax=Brachionus plicatilis TaxID=10195 RepID=A0A3M7SDL5_BRAPC|nr:vesicle-associated membrane 4 [Brachionus plicatilis]
MSDIEKTALLCSDEDDDRILDLNKNKPDTKINRLQSQVNDVIDGMKVNIEKVVERGQNLEALNERSESLSVSGDLFSKRAKNLRKHMWLRTCRARMYLGITLGSILILIVCKINN